MEALFSSVFGPPCIIQTKIHPINPERPSRKVGYEELLVFKGGERVSGEITISPKSGKALEHAGIKIEFIGQIEMLFGGGSPFEFTSFVKELEHPGILDRVKTYSFDFGSMDTPYESYDGLNVRVRYLLKVTISRHLAMNVTKEQDIWLVNIDPPPEINPTSKTEVGVSGFLHIEVHLAKEKFHLKEVIVGKIFFAKVKLRIKSMEAILLKKEKIGSGLINVDENSKTETTQIGRYELMDGFPARGESIPVRIFLAQHDNLTPTYKNFNNQFSVEYCLSIVLIDETNRRYFREHEIELYRRDLS